MKIYLLILPLTSRLQTNTLRSDNSYASVRTNETGAVQHSDFTDQLQQKLLTTRTVKVSKSRCLPTTLSFVHFA